MLPWVPYWLVLALQAFCVVHLIRRRGNFMWLWAIIFLPLLGCLLYLVLEVRPGTGGGFSIDLASLPGFEKLRLRRLETALAECDSIDNRYALAEMHLQYDRAQEAQAVLRPALEGPLKSNPYLILAMARIEHANGDHRAALAQLARLDASGVTIKAKERRLLAALAHAASGGAAAAEPELAVLAGTFDGEEARYRYARFLLDAGRRSEAIEIADQGIAWYRRSEGLYRRSEWRWYRGLKAVRAAARRPPPAGQDSSPVA